MYRKEKKEYLSVSNSLSEDWALLDIFELVSPESMETLSAFRLLYSLQVIEGLCTDKLKRNDIISKGDSFNN